MSLVLSFLAFSLLPCQLSIATMAIFLPSSILPWISSPNMPSINSTPNAGCYAQASNLGKHPSDVKLIGNTRTRHSLLLSVPPLPLLVAASLPGADTVTDLFQPFVELVRSFNLPDWLVHWGHPGNMAVVLFAMGGYGSYLGWQIRLSDDVEMKAKAKDLHPKLLGGMFFFFALGATGGITSLLTSGKPIFESSHAVTGFTGLILLTIQATLTSFFENNPGLRTIHGILGSGTMLLFLIHAALGLQLGLSY